MALMKQEFAHGRVIVLDAIYWLEVIANVFGEEGNHSESVKIATQAVDVWTACVARTNSDELRSSLAGALMTLARQLLGARRPHDAHQRSSEAIRIYRELAISEPYGYIAELASALNTQAEILNRLRHYETAALVAEESVQHHRYLVRVQRRKFQRGLALSLGHLAKTLFHRGDPSASLALSERALAIYRKLATRSVDGVEPEFTQLLIVQSMRCAATGSKQRARRLSQEAFRVMRANGDSPGALLFWSAQIIFREFHDMCAQCGIQSGSRKFLNEVMKRVRKLYGSAKR
jgi:hypothetical protein